MVFLDRVINYSGRMDFFWVRFPDFVDTDVFLLFQGPDWKTLFPRKKIVAFCIDKLGQWFLHLRHLIPLPIDPRWKSYSINGSMDYRVAVLDFAMLFLVILKGEQEKEGMSSLTKNLNRLKKQIQSSRLISIKVIFLNLFGNEIN